MKTEKAKLNYPELTLKEVEQRQQWMWGAFIGQLIGGIVLLYAIKELLGFTGFIVALVAYVVGIGWIGKKSDCYGHDVGIHRTREIEK